MKVRFGAAATVALASLTAVACSLQAGQQVSVAPDPPMAAVVSDPEAEVRYVDPGYAAFGDQHLTTVGVRRLTESQYRNTIADVFGPEITINARFEPERREDGLQAIGNVRLSVSTTGLEQYFSVARSIADQVMADEGRDRIIGCQPASVDDRACAESFIKSRGMHLFSRPLTDGEIEARLAIWSEGAQQKGDFHEGLKLALVSLLVDPEFLFRKEYAEADPADPDALRMSAYTKAARLSFMLWDTAPDAELLGAAQSGAIHSSEGLAGQVDRLLASDRLEQGARAFFTDMLHFDKYETLTKDPGTYPKFSQAVADSSREETLRFLVDHLIAQDRDYRDIFTSRDTILNRSLAAVYQIPYPSTEDWARYTFPEDSDRSGVLTQVSFLSLFSHPASSSPTVRGVKLHEIFMCLPTPEPPADVDFSKVQALENGTVRERLIDHMTNPGCNTCHAISDPAGLSLEHFDGLGQTRRLENGQPIDVSAKIGDLEFSGAPGLGQYLRGSPLVTSCIVRNVHYYGAGRPFDYKDAAYLAEKGEAFASGGYRMTELYRSILTDPDFYQVIIPDGAGPDDGDAEALNDKHATTGAGQ